MELFRKKIGGFLGCEKLPDLLQMQKDSFERFFQMSSAKGNRKRKGLQLLLEKIFSIDDDSKVRIEFVKYGCSPPIFNQAECIRYGIDYTASLFIWLRINSVANQNVRSEKEAPFYVGEVPLLTEVGSFIINGSDRVIMAQFRKAPGLYVKANDANGKTITRIIPLRGAWLELELGDKGFLCSKMDQKKRILLPALLEAFGITKENIKTIIERPKVVLITRTRLFIGSDCLTFGSGRCWPLVNAIQNKPQTDLNLDFKLKTPLRELSCLELITTESSLKDYCLAPTGTGHPAVKMLSFKYLELQRKMQAHCCKIMPLGVSEFVIFMKEIYVSMKSGGNLEENISKHFNSERNYDLSISGRQRFDSRVFEIQSSGANILRDVDIIGALSFTIKARIQNLAPDDMDHLQNKRVLSVGEIFEEKFRVGFMRAVSLIEDSFIKSIKICRPNLSFIIREVIINSFHKLFIKSNLAQITDQSNPLADISHKRRVMSSMASGSSKKRAGLDVRDVHQSHYSKICPVETPEGHNIGLINSFAISSKINDEGMLMAPYKTMRDGRIAGDYNYLTAQDEEELIISMVSSNSADELLVRHKGKITLAARSSVKLVDANPFQIVSVATALIPFLEHNDINRALMGSNMQRQAVVCLTSERPLIGTNIERNVAKDSRSCIVSSGTGSVKYVDSKLIVINERHNRVITKQKAYNLMKYSKTNQNAYVNYEPVVKLGDQVTAGDLIADSTSTEKGELALGKNVLVAFMPWNGYNFEDSIVVSERLCSEGSFTSVYVEEFFVTIKDSKDSEEKTSNKVICPNAHQLDDDGIIKVGSRIAPGFVLVGRIITQRKKVVAPEAKLLLTAFNKKTQDANDLSVMVPHGMRGVVTEVSVIGNCSSNLECLQDLRADLDQIELNTFVRLHNYFKSKVQCSRRLKGIDPYKWFLTPNGPNSLSDLKGEHLELNNAKRKVHLRTGFKIQRLTKVESSTDDASKVIKIEIAVERKLQPGDKMSGRHGNKGVVSRIVPIEEMPYTKDGIPVDIVLNPLGVPSRMNIGQLMEVHFGLLSNAINKRFIKASNSIESNLYCRIKDLAYQFYNKPEERKMLLYLSERGLFRLINNQPKGMPLAIIPFECNYQSNSSWLINGAIPFKAQGISNIISSRCQMFLFDGAGGELFDYPITVGIMYCLKLHHLAEDKIHSRLTGPYSTVTQQPLRGKAQYGGQRFGEMEVWALEAYGAAYVLQEMITVKSDDLWGRVKMYENILKGNLILNTKTPESFNVLVRELRALGIELNVDPDE